MDRLRSFRIYSFVLSSILASLCSALPSLALTADLHGTVVSSNTSSPIPGCTVFVKGTSGLAATTDAQGKFSLTGTTLVAAEVATGNDMYRVNGQSLEIALPTLTNIVIDVYDLGGKRLCRSVNSRFPAGTHRIDPLAPLAGRTADAFYIVSAHIGARHYSSKLSTLSGDGRAVTAASSRPAYTRHLSHAAAAKGDTLIVDCAHMPNTEVALSSLSGSVGEISVRGMMKKPNFMFILADDLTATDIGMMGNPDVITPAIDTLANQGMVFEEAYCATAMCAPLRMSLYTGIYPVRNGGYPNHSKTYNHIRSVVHHLGALGYRVALTGKRHFNPTKPCFPFEFIGGTGGVNHTAIKNFVSKDTAKPYCLFVCSHFPHGGWSSGDRSPYDANTVRVDPYHVDTKEYRTAKVAYYAEIGALDDEVAGCMKIVDESAQKDNTLLMFASEQGNSFPGGKWTCWEPGLKSVFVARFPGIVKAGARTRAMVNYIDVVPTFVDLAKGKQIDSLDGRSFLPVLLGKTDTHRTHDFGIHTSKGIGGAPKGGYAVRSVRTRTHKYIWNLQHETTFTCAISLDKIKNGDAVAFRSWKAAMNEDSFAKKIVDRFENRPELEFYDLTKDPYELNDLASDPTQKPLMDSLRTILDAWMTQQGDLGIKTEQTSR